MVQKDCQITSVNCPLCIQSYVFFFPLVRQCATWHSNISWFHSALFKFYADDSLVNTLSKRDAHDGIYCYEEKESKRSFSVVANVDLLQLRWSFVDKNTKTLSTVHLCYFSVLKVDNTCNVNWLCDYLTVKINNKRMLTCFKTVDAS